MGECGSLRLKILFWMSEHLYFLHLSSLSNLISLCSVFIIHMSLLRSVMSGSAAQVQLGWDCNFPSPGKYLMLFAVICMSEHTFITLWFFFQIINISGVCILRKTLFCGKVLCNTSHLDSEKHLQSALAVTWKFMRGLEYLKHWTYEAEVTVLSVHLCMHDCVVLSRSWECSWLAVSFYVFFPSMMRFFLIPFSSFFFLHLSLSLSLSLSFSLSLWQISSS